MDQKYVSFAKNMVIAGVAGLAAGAGVAELSNLLTDNKTTTAILSTASEYIAAYAAFLPLHAKDNQDIYKTNTGKFKHKEFIYDQIKLAGSFAALDIAYLIGRPILTKKFLDSGIDPALSSLYADAAFYSLFALAAFPLAKLTGNLRSNKTKLEEKV
jgi:hypothetical protein